jgi:hypothetical protein
LLITQSGVGSKNKREGGENADGVDQDDTMVEDDHDANENDVGMEDV